MLALCDGVSHRLHQFGMLVFGLCISQPVHPVQCISRVRFQLRVSDQPEGNLSFYDTSLGSIALCSLPGDLFWAVHYKKKRSCTIYII